MSAARWARIGYSLVAWLFAGLAIVQVYLAGLAVFVTNHDFELHRNFGYLIGVLTLVLVVLALAGRMPLRVIAASALLLGLIALQSVLVFMRTDQPNVAALHPVNGFLIVVLALWLAWRSVGYIRAPLPPERPKPMATPAPPAAAAPDVAGEEA
jgi:cytochrome b561